MRFFSSKILVNILFIFVLFYLVYHTFNGKYNVQNFLINKFESKLFQDFHYNLKQKTLAIDMDLNALRNESDDFLDELSKQFSEPENGEILFKLD